MKVSNYADTKPVQELPGVTVRDIIKKEEAPHFVMRLFEVEPGSATAPHVHWWEHEVFVLSGCGMVVGEHEKAAIQAGSVIYIPPEERHHFLNNGSDPLRYLLLNPLRP